jgi:hypothetical protein
LKAGFTEEQAIHEAESLNSAFEHVATKDDLAQGLKNLENSMTIKFFMAAFVSIIVPVALKIIFK